MTEPTNLDTAWWQKEDSPEKPRLYTGVVRSSFYLTMRDGVRIAVDCYLPASLKTEDRLPGIIHQTRYYRRTIFRIPFQGRMEKQDLFLQGVRRLVENGYAFVAVDARGSGASFGMRNMEWSPDEVKDGAEIVSWIVKQPWSNGLVGTMGVSYNGTAAEMLLQNQHPAVKAAIIQFAVFDIYTDILRPGGIFNQGFLSTWSELNKNLDENTLSAFARKNIGLLAGLAIKGVAPVDEDYGKKMLQAAFIEHQQNYDIYQTSQDARFYEDVTRTGVALADFSPHAFREKTEGSGAAIYSWSSWFDGAYPNAAIKRFLNIHTPGSRLLLGPWDHGAVFNPNPFAPDEKVRFDTIGEALRFFDHHLKGLETGIETESQVHYYTMGVGTWKSAETWPPPGFDLEPFYFTENLGLQPGEAPDPKDPGADTFQVDNATSSGTPSRWLSQVNVAQKRIQYPDRNTRDARLLTYTSQPLPEPLEITGHPIITLYLRSSETDAQIFVYLEDLSPDGAVHYITEGLFRASARQISWDQPPYQITHGPYHTFKRADVLPLEPGEIAEITFDLLPVSHQFKKGHSIRVAIAGADADNFELFPKTPPILEFQRKPPYPSHILLPVKQNN